MHLRGGRPLERFLSLFAEVRTGEAPAVLALTLNVFLLLNAYYLLKPVREALILSVPGGAELKSYTAVLQAVLLLFVVPLYGWLGSRVRRRQLINIVSLFFVACMMVFYFLIKAHVHVGVVFFLWIGIYSLMIVAQFWSFANDIYTPEAGKRLFAIVGFGASLGAVVGSAVAGSLIRALGVEQMLPLAAVLLVASLVLTYWVDTHTRSANSSSPRAEIGPLRSGSAYRLITHNRYLLLMAIMILAYNWVNSNGEYILSHMVAERSEELIRSGQLAEVDQMGYIGEFFAKYFAAASVLSLLLQLFVVSRLIKYFDIPAAVCVMPILSLLGLTVIAIIPSLVVVRWMKVTENATDYSLQNTVRQMLFLPLTREEKYTGKQAIDTFFVRCGDVLSALLVYVGSGMLLWQARDFAIANLFIAAVWLALAVLVGREYRKRVHLPQS
ncbi:MAG: Npt1/Npt2 family nucleotide transporter [Pseudomonadota bacterium]